MLTLHSKNRVKIIILHFCDGDTIKAHVFCPTCKCSREQYIRLKGIESYEMRSPDREKAKIVANKWTERYAQTSAELIITQSGSDKYGRIVGSVYIGNESLAEMLVTANDAWYHDHKRKS